MFCLFVSSEEFEQTIILCVGRNDDDDDMVYVIIIMIILSHFQGFLAFYIIHPTPFVFRFSHCFDFLSRNTANSICSLFGDENLRWKGGNLVYMWKKKAPQYKWHVSIIGLL